MEEGNLVELGSFHLLLRATTGLEYLVDFDHRTERISVMHDGVEISPNDLPRDLLQAATQRVLHLLHRTDAELIL